MSVSDQIDMSALQSHHSEHCFQRMRLMTAYGTEFFWLCRVKMVSGNLLFFFCNVTY
jgi:hypothetical protein